jgi:diguanylate cyclase (GGDEF)-like protein
MEAVDAPVVRMRFRETAMADPRDRDRFDQTIQDSCDMSAEGTVVQIPYLLVLHGDDRGRRFPLRQGNTTLGRETDADLVIKDSRISRVHCTFRITAQGVSLYDNGSRNGTFINGMRISGASPVTADSRIRIGRTLMKISYKSQEEIQIEEEAFRDAVTDPLTGVPNRRWLYEQSGPVLAHAKRHASPLSLLMLDVDHFKKVNDRYGHAAGDDVLSAVGGLLQDSKRQDDLLGRYGGEEFVLVLQGAALANARTLAERLRGRVSALPIETGKGAVRITVSIGVAELRVDDTMESLLKRADEALYRAKEEGRDRVVCEAPE